MLDVLLSNFPIIIFIFALAIYAVGAFIIVYHLIRFGVGNAPKVVAFVFFAGSVALSLIALYVVIS